MKLIIDIPDDAYKKIIADKYAIYDRMYYSIKNGTPLDNLRAEISENIEAFSMSDWETNNILADGLQMALNIIDGYREGEQP